MRGVACTLRRGGRVVECGGLENRLALSGHEGSNPSSSARFHGTLPVGSVFFCSWPSQGFEPAKAPIADVDRNQPHNVNTRNMRNPPSSGGFQTCKLLLPLLFSEDECQGENDRQDGHNSDEHKQDDCQRLKLAILDPLPQRGRGSPQHGNPQQREEVVDDVIC